jgi:hypothetical protein
MKPRNPWIKKMKLLNRTFLFCMLFLMAQNVWALGNAQPLVSPQDNDAIAGEFFGVKVPMENYEFVEGVVKIFGNRWGSPPKTPQELKGVIWEQLLLSFLAFSQNVNVTENELEEGITKMLADEKVTFDWKLDKPSYEQWAKKKTGDSVELFENQLRHLIQLQKLRDKVMDSIKPEVFDKHEVQKFLDQNNALNLEAVQFNKQQDADEFFRKASGRTDFWERQKKRRPADFKQSGLVALELLADSWKIPAEALRKMIQRNVGDIYPPRAVANSYAVFKILEKKLTDESQFPKASDPYYVDLIKKKKQEGLKEWLRQLKDQANINIYNKEGGKA